MAFGYVAYHLYHGDYTVHPSFSWVKTSSVWSEPEENILLHAKIYAAAHYFGSDSIRVKALDRFKCLAKDMAHSKGFRDAVEFMFNSDVDSELRDVALDIIAQKKTWLVTSEADHLINNLGISHDILQRVGRPEGAMTGREGNPETFGQELTTPEPTTCMNCSSSADAPKKTSPRGRASARCSRGRGRRRKATANR